MVQDFHIGSVYSPVSPLVLVPTGKETTHVLVRLKAGSKADASVSSIEALWKTKAPDFPLSYSFLSDQYSSLYQNEESIGMLIRVFSALALLISSLGLFGLSSYSAQTRAKEIAIRKVLGASVRQIMLLLGKDILLLVLLANLLAYPVT